MVLCHPMGQEYIRSHRSYRLLALRLSQIGYHVLRFDFYGCGDSSGDFEQAQLHQWLGDISTATGEIRDRCGVANVCLVGLRFGATLSMLAGAEQGDIDSLVLWDPIVSGRDYIEEMQRLHQERLPQVSPNLQGPITGPRYAEILGFPLTDPLWTELETIDLLAIRQRPAQHSLVLDSQEKRPGGEAERLCDHLARLGVLAKYRHLPGPPIWIEIANRGLVPHQLLQSLVAWMTEVHA